MCGKCKGIHFKYIDGIPCCILCGQLKDIVPEIIPMEYDPKGPAPEERQKPIAKTAAEQLIETFKDSIINLRQSTARTKRGQKAQAPSSWDTITKLLAKATGKKLQSKTIQKYANAAGIA